MSDKKALVVDDEIHIVQVVAIKLRNNGFDVTTAENGAVALEIAKQDKPDIIVTDFQMPVMSRLELIENLRQDEQTKDIPVIMFSEVNKVTKLDFGLDGMEEYLGSRPAVFLEKPVSTERLRQAVMDAISNGKDAE